MGLTMPSHRQQVRVAVWLRNDFATAVLDADCGAHCLRNDIAGRSTA